MQELENLEQEVENGEPLYIITKDEFLDKISALLAPITHVAIPVERVESFGMSGFQHNAFGLIAVGLNLESLGAVFDILEQLVIPSTGWSTFCNDEKFMEDAIERAKEIKQAFETAKASNNEHLRHVAEVLSSDVTTEQEKATAAMELIADAIQKHEASQVGEA